MSKIDPDSFYGQVLLNVVDKIIIGVIAAIILLSLQARFQQEQQRKDQQAAITNFRVETIVEERKNLQRVMRDYFRLIDRYRAARRIPDSEIGILQDLRLKIEAALLNVETFAPNETVQKQPFIDSVMSMNGLLLEGYTTEQLKDESKKVQVEYRKMLNQLNNAAIKALEKNNPENP